MQVYPRKEWGEERATFLLVTQQHTKQQGSVRCDIVKDGHEMCAGAKFCFRDVCHILLSSLFVSNNAVPALVKKKKTTKQKTKKIEN